VCFARCGVRLLAVVYVSLRVRAETVQVKHGSVRFSVQSSRVFSGSD
jgi:hypothetical protein